MTWPRIFLAGIAVVALTVGIVRLWPRASKEVWVGHPVRPAFDWNKRVSDWSDSPSIALASVDRIKVHAIDPHIVEVDPQARGTIPLGQLSTTDLGAALAHRRDTARRFRQQSKQTLFPTAPTSVPHHVIVASKLLQGDDAQQLSRLWQSQTLDCDPPNAAAFFARLGTVTAPHLHVGRSQQHSVALRDSEAKMDQTWSFCPTE